MPKGTELTRRGFTATNRSLGKQPPPRPLFIEKQSKFTFQTAEDRKNTNLKVTERRRRNSEPWYSTARDSNSSHADHDSVALATRQTRPQRQNKSSNLTLVVMRSQIRLVKEGSENETTIGSSLIKNYHQMKDLRSSKDDLKKLNVPAHQWTATAASDVVQSGRPIFDDFFQHLWPYIGNNTANVVFQMVKRLWLILIDQ
ncbi:hypothetical protein TNCV_312691 [Trichonephila clavipes]|nr:hypothetical protein TNCV_312691 [Trichonephila clavipes]